MRWSEAIVKQERQQVHLYMYCVRTTQ